MMIRTRNPYFRLVDDLLNDARPWLTSGVPSEARGFGLALDVEENANAYIVRANLPGISQDDISVNIHEDVLSVSAETAAENRDETSKMLIRERRFGRFSRSLRFPTNVDGDAVEASYENGVLSITLPKAEHVKPRQIPVNVSEAAS
ncbi:MAG: Hsp20/alpha crystallin family protein [Chloroflexi bacterium]|nr:Hsp20/alpha crystallin family protein [Chloroflexota bacterium]